MPILNLMAAAGSKKVGTGHDVEDFSSLTSLSLTREGVSDQTVCLEPYQYEPLTQAAEQLTCQKRVRGEASEW